LGADHPDECGSRIAILGLHCVGGCSASDKPLTFDGMADSNYGQPMRTLHNLTIVSLFTLGLATFASEFPDSWTFDKEATMRAGHAALEGKPMPGLAVADWINGQIKPEEMNGKVVIVDFYATWCGPCMAAIPHNNELLKKYKDKGLVIVGVCTSGRGQEKMEQNAKEKGIEYPVARDPGQKSATAWAVHYYPTYAVVDRKGVVRALGLQPSHVESVIKKLLDESVASAGAASKS
jgi:thiol-disulfide isomerase/thioredoxin